MFGYEEKLSCNKESHKVLSLTNNVMPYENIITHVIALLVGDSKIVISPFHGSLSLGFEGLNANV